MVCLLALMMPMWAGKHKDDGPVVAAYVTGWNEFKELPDCSVLTHINYAFGKVNETYDGVIVQYPERLRQLVELKKDHKIYIVLSIGGWTAGGFSEMASTHQRRKAFARDCKRIVKEYDLDGIDIDWEYPSCSEAGITARPADIDNFTLLMRGCIYSQVGLIFMGLIPLEENWGVMINQAWTQGAIYNPNSIMYIIAPTVMICLLITSLVWVGKALEDVFNPALLK